MEISVPIFRPIRQRSLVIAATALVHVTLLFAWQASRPLPALDDGAAPRRIQWIWLPQPAIAIKPATPAQSGGTTPGRVPSVPRTSSGGQDEAIRARITTPAADAPRAGPPETESFSATAPVQAPPGVLQRALRAAGGIDRALRKENNPYIVAPLDSPQIRMRRGMQAAADLAPGKWYEAPKVEELVNNTGDGARRTRVVTGNGTYCVTERATNTSIDMIEKHGKLRLTSCPEHETPASAQQWRTARD